MKVVIGPGDGEESSPSVGQVEDPYVVVGYDAQENIIELDTDVGEGEDAYVPTIPGESDQDLDDLKKTFGHELSGDGEGKDFGEDTSPSLSM